MKHHAFSALSLLLLATACSSGDAASTPAGGADADADADAGAEAADAPTANPGADATVAVFSQEPVYFAGADNKRNVDATVDFPADGSYASVTFRVTLDCPSGRCDPYDRFGSIGIVPDEASDATIELVRFVTPFGVGADFSWDATDLRPLLRGKVHLRGFIDTWVGPGSPYGDGWLLTASVEMTGGTPEHEPLAVVPVWTMRSVTYGDPAHPTSEFVAPATLAVPSGATQLALRSFVTGHGQGNADNCAEFCAKDHTMTVGATPYVTRLWRDDCATSGAPGQHGTFQYARSGWCPGASVEPWTADVTADLAPSVTVAYDVEAFENTCRPDAATCSGCSLGTGCAYDDGAHTEPHWFVSALLVARR